MKDTIKRQQETYCAPECKHMIVAPEGILCTSDKTLYSNEAFSGYVNYGQGSDWY